MVSRTGLEYTMESEWSHSRLELAPEEPQHSLFQIGTTYGTESAQHSIYRKRKEHGDVRPSIQGFL